MLRCEIYRLGITNWLAGTSAKSSSVDNRRVDADGLTFSTTFASMGVDVIGGFVMLLTVDVSILAVDFDVPGRDNAAVPVRYFRFRYIFFTKCFREPFVSFKLISVFVDSSVDSASAPFILRIRKYESVMMD